MTKATLVSNRYLRGLLVIAGFLFVGIGLIGIVVPILPTTPFLLLAAACFARSSERFHHWLMTNKVFGRYISNYIEGKGVPLKLKMWTISLLWVAILTSVYFFVDNVWVQMVLVAIALGVSLHLALIKTYNNQRK